MQRAVFAGAQSGRDLFQFADFPGHDIQGDAVPAPLRFATQLVQFQELVVNVDQMLCHTQNAF